MADAAPNLPGFGLTSDVLDAARHRVLTYTSVDAIPLPPPPGPAMQLIGQGQPGVLSDGKGSTGIVVKDRWLRANGRDPLASGWNAATADATGPDLLTLRDAPGAWAENLILERGGQNLVISGITGSATVLKVQSRDAWGMNKGGMFRGSGLYAENVKGPLTIDQCVFDQNGWQPGLPPHERDPYGHALYLQRGSGPALVRATALMRAANAGAMLRSAGRVEGSLVADCGTGIIAMGRGDTVDVADSVILAGHHYWDGSAWTGATAILSYAKLLRLTNVLIVALPGMGNADPIALPTEKNWNAGCIALSSTYTAQHPDWADPYPAIQTTNVHVFGWPGATLTLNNKPLALPAGLTIHPNPVSFDSAGLMADVRSGKTSVAAAIAAVRAAAGVN